MATRDASRRIVLIGGMPRSGTTLVETVVGSHSRVSIPPGDFPYAERAVNGLAVEKIFSIFMQKQTWELWEVQDFSSVYAMEHGEAFRTTLVRYADGVGKDIPGAKAPFSEFYLEHYRRWLANDDLRFVYVLRNPFDMLASLKHSHIHKGWQNFTDLIEIHSKNWVRSASIALARAHANPEGFAIFRYEDFAGDPVRYGEEICRFIGVDFEEDTMLNRKDYAYHDTNTSFPDRYEARQDKSRYIYPAESRKKTLSRDEIDRIGQVCGEIAVSLGYEDPDFVTVPPGKPQKLDSPTKMRRFAKRVYRKLVN